MADPITVRFRVRVQYLEECKAQLARVEREVAELNRLMAGVSVECEPDDEPPAPAAPAAASVAIPLRAAMERGRMPPPALA